MKAIKTIALLLLSLIILVPISAFTYPKPADAFSVFGECLWSCGGSLQQAESQAEAHNSVDEPTSPLPLPPTPPQNATTQPTTSATLGICKFATGSEFRTQLQCQNEHGMVWLPPAQSSQYTCAQQGGQVYNCGATPPAVEQASQPQTQPTQAPAPPAQGLTYVPLEPLPQVGRTTVDYRNFASYLSYIFPILIIIGGLIGVARLTLGGFTYMFSNVPAVKSRSLGTIFASLWGLVLLISIVVILYAINPALTNFNLSSLTNIGTSQ